MNGRCIKEELFKEFVKMDKKIKDKKYILKERLLIRKYYKKYQNHYWIYIIK